MYGKLYKNDFSGIVWWNVVLKIVIVGIFGRIFWNVLIFIMFVGLWSGVKLDKVLIFVSVLFVIKIELVNFFLLCIIWWFILVILLYDWMMFWESNFLIKILIVIVWLGIFVIFVCFLLFIEIVKIVLFKLICFIKFFVNIVLFGILNNWNLSEELLVLIVMIFDIKK